MPAAFCSSRRRGVRLAWPLCWQFAGVDRRLGDVAHSGVGVLGAARGDHERLIAIQIKALHQDSIANPTTLRASMASAIDAACRAVAAATEAGRARMCAVASPSRGMRSVVRRAATALPSPAAEARGARDRSRPRRPPPASAACGRGDDVGRHEGVTGQRHQGGTLFDLDLRPVRGRHGRVGSSPDRGPAAAGCRRDADLLAVHCL